MSYSDFTLEIVVDELGRTVRSVPLFAPEPRAAPSAWLREPLDRGAGLARSEHASGKFTIAPIPLHCREELGRSFPIHSGTTFDVDPERGLSGECYYVRSGPPPAPILLAPFSRAVEARRQDMELDREQCAAPMLAATLFNQVHGWPFATFPGCVTTGHQRQFLKLEAQNLQVDTRRYFLNLLDTILGALTNILRPPDPSMRPVTAA
jgi:hypothetical protein